MLTDAQIQEGLLDIAQYYYGGEILRNEEDKGYSLKTDNRNADWDVFEFHNNWSAQIPVWSKLAHESKELVAKLDEFTYKWWLKICEKYETAIYNNNPQQGFTVLLELLTWYKNNKV